MSFTNMLGDVIINEFEMRVGRNSDKAMLIEFNTKVDWDKEEGYRYTDLLIYAPSNYVQVWARDRWNVCPLEDMEYDEPAMDMVPKPGKDYVQGETEWRMLTDHDCAWREDGIRRFLRVYRAELMRFATIGLHDWYKIVPPPAGMDRSNRGLRCA